MKEWICALVRKELASRGYDADGKSPNGSIVLDYDQLAEIELGDMLDQLVVRREKIFRALETLGKERAQQSWEDTERAIDSLKAVIQRLSA